MPKVKATSKQGLRLPEDFLRRRNLPADMEYWLDSREGDLILRPCLPDIRKLYVEPTSGCNLQCHTCIRNVWDDPSAPMSGQTFERMMQSTAALPELKRVVFTGFGEPLTHPRILDMVEAVRRRDLAVTIGTNGVLLTPKMSRQLVQLGVDRVMVSIDGGKPETFSEVRGAALAQVVENIRYLNEAKTELRSLYPAVGIEFVALRKNIDELGDVARLAAQLNVSRVLVSNVLPYTQEMREEVLYGYGLVSPLKTSSWALKADAWVMWATQEPPRMHWGAARRCRFIQNHATVVGWDGGVTPCYALAHNYSYYAIDGQQKQVSRYLLGNVNQHSLAEIWMTEEYMGFRSEVKIFHFPSCPDCDLRETCDLRQQNKGCWGWNPSCADCLWAQDIVRCP